MPRPQLVVNIAEGRRGIDITTAGSTLGYMGYGTRIDTPTNPLQYNTPILINNRAQLSSYISATGEGDAYQDLSDMFDVSGDAPIYIMIVNPADTTTANTWEEFTGNGGINRTGEKCICKLIDFSISNTQVGSIDLLAVHLYELNSTPATISGGTEIQPITIATNGLRGGLDNVAIGFFDSLGTIYESLYSPLQFFLATYPEDINSFIAGNYNYYTNDSRFISLFASSVSITPKKATSIGRFVGFVATKSIASSLAETVQGGEIAPTSTPVYFNSYSGTTSYDPTDTTNFDSDGLDVSETMPNYQTIANTGLLILERRQGLNGYYVNQDDTLVEDQQSLTRRVSTSRVLNVVLFAGVGFLRRFQDSRVRSLPNGLIDPVFASALESRFETVFLPLVAENNLGSVECIVPRNQNVSTTEKLIITLQVQTVPKAGIIEFNISLTPTIQ